MFGLVSQQNSKWLRWLLDLEDEALAETGNIILKASPERVIK